MSAIVGLKVVRHLETLIGGNTEGHAWVLAFGCIILSLSHVVRTTIKIQVLLENKTDLKLHKSF